MRGNERGDQRIFGGGGERGRKHTTPATYVSAPKHIKNMYVAGARVRSARLRSPATVFEMRSRASVK